MTRAQVVLARRRRGQRVEQQVQRRARASPASSAVKASARPASGRARRRMRAAQPVGLEGAGDVASSASASSRLAAGVQQRGASATAASARPGSSSSARRSEASSPAATSSSASEGTSPSKKRSTARRRLRADELVDDPAVLEGLDGRDALDAEARGELRVGVGVDLGQDDLALALGGRLLEQRRELAAGPAPLRPEVDDDGHALRPLEDLLLEVCSVTSIDGHDP